MGLKHELYRLTSLNKIYFVQKFRIKKRGWILHIGQILAKNRKRQAPGLFDSSHFVLIGQHSVPLVHLVLLNYFFLFKIMIIHTNELLKMLILKISQTILIENTKKSR